MAFSKKVKIGCGVGLVLATGIGVFFGPAVADLWEVGKAYLEKDEKRAYSGNSAQNLKALHTAMMLYHESEGQFPSAPGWMDALKSRVQTNDLEAAEALKKFVRPGSKPGEYGYSMNLEASSKYEDDLPKDSILIFESEDTSWNATSVPKGGEQGIAVDGSLLPTPMKTQ